MNPFEQATIIFGVLAILFEGVGYVRGFIHKLFH
jgi:transcriptional regulator of nitric oxide reductase